MPNDAQPPSPRPASPDIPWTSVRDEIYNPENANGPSPLPRTTEEALHLMTGPFAVPVNGHTAIPLRLASHVAPFTTEVLRNLRPDGPKKVPRETVVKVAQECHKMFENARILADTVLCVCQEREGLSVRIKAIEQKLKEQEAEFERRQRQQQLNMEAIFGGSDAEEPLVPPGRYKH